MNGDANNLAYEFGEFRLRPARRELQRRNGPTIAVTPKAFDALLYFVERRGELLDKATLMKTIWPDVVVEENNLNQLISAIRKALGESSGENRFIATVPGRGYRFVAAVVATEDSPTTAPDPPAVKRLMSRWPVLLTTLVIGVAAAGYLAHLLSQRQQSHAPSLDAVRSAVAVMPFANLTGDASKDYLGDGMAAELINALATAPGLYVPARTSSFAYKGRNADARQIASDLGVAFVLEGSIRSAGERIRVTVELVDGQSGYRVWSQSYDRETKDLFKLQDALANSSVQAIRTRLGADLPIKMSLPRPTQDIEAYELDLQGQSIMELGTEESFERALQLFKRASALDPQFARPIANIARAYVQQFQRGYATSASLIVAQQEAEHALTIDPKLIEPRVVAGQIAAFHGEWSAAERHFAKVNAAIFPMGRAIHAVSVTGPTGHLRRGVEEIRKSYRLSPNDVTFVVLMSAAYMSIGLDDEAQRYARLAVDLGYRPAVAPLARVRAVLALREGRVSEAAERSIEGLPADLRASGGDDVIRSIYAAMEHPDQRPSAIAALRRLMARTSPANLLSTTRNEAIAWYTQLGALDDAYSFANSTLDEHLRQGTIGPLWVWLWIPEMRPFRLDPRFQKFVTRMKLIDYWQEYGPPDECDLKDDKLICH